MSVVRADSREFELSSTSSALAMKKQRPLFRRSLKVAVAFSIGL
jgi:hypothetical protein